MLGNNHPKVVHPWRFSSPNSSLRDSLYLSVFYSVFYDSRFTEDFIWYGKLFQILGLKMFRLLLPKVTWLWTGIFKFKKYFPRKSLLVSLKDLFFLTVTNFELFFFEKNEFWDNSHNFYYFWKKIRSRLHLPHF